MPALIACARYLSYANTKRTQQNKNFVAFRVIICYNYVKISYTRLPVIEFTYVATIIQECIVLTYHLKSYLLKDMLAATILVNGICVHTDQVQFTESEIQCQNFSPRSVSLIFDIIILQMNAKRTGSRVTIYTLKDDLSDWLFI